MTHLHEQFSFIAEILVIIILALLGFLWRDLNSKIKTLFSSQDTFVTKDLMRVGVTANITQLHNTVTTLNKDLRQHMDTERITYGVLAGIMLVGFFVMAIALIVIYMNLKGG